MKLRGLSLAIVIALAAGTAVAARPASYWRGIGTYRLQALWGDYEEECRGGQHDPSDAVCRDRDRITNELQRRGICWAYSDWRVTPAEYRWHPCRQRRP